MDLINGTAVPVDLTVADIPDEPRLGALTAKATFRFSGARTVLDSQRPIALLHGDGEHAGSFVPADVLPRRSDDFEVMLIGSARSARGPIARRRLRLSVGAVTRELEVIGDRAWLRSGDGWVASAPFAFEHMPLTWERAFGGSAAIAIDDGATMPLSEPMNPLGRGFDFDALAEPIGRALGCPPGYPIVPGPRLLPNLEDPAALIRAIGDRPVPKCWAPMPFGVGLRLAPVVDRMSGYDRGDPELAGGTAEDRQELLRRGFLFAHPEWIIARPTPRARVRIEGLFDEVIDFELPQLRVLADYAVAGRRGTRELVPHALVLLPDESRFYLIYRGFFRVDYAPGVERCVRMRLETGWLGGN